MSGCRLPHAASAVLGAVAAVAITTSDASAAGKLTLYCSTQIEYCQILVQEFEKASGVKVAMTRKSTGETFAQIKAESSNPKGDVWWGGTGDPHLQAAEEGLTQPYRSFLLDQQQDWARRPADLTGNRTVGIYAGALGFGYNTEVIKEKGLPEPKCWKDLIKPVYKGQVQMANPNSSGTAYTALATIVQLFGEDEGFEFMKGLHRNISQYTKSGSAPIKAAARGENTIGVAFLADAVNLTVKGFPIKAVAPCEGTGYEIGGMSIIEGARNLDSAKTFVDWALTAEAQELGAKVQQFETPANKNAGVPPEAPKLEDIKLIDYDFKKYGSAAERKRLLAKWDNDVKSLPQ